MERRCRCWVLWIALICAQVLPLGATDPFEYDWNAMDGNVTDTDIGNASFPNISLPNNNEDDWSKSALLQGPIPGDSNCLAGDSSICCQKPYEAAIVRGRPFCCKPNTTRPNDYLCCPLPLIPSQEPNVDPSLGPFCCNVTTGDCCTKDRDGIFPSIPFRGRCCIGQSACCPRPLFHRISKIGSPFPICCSKSDDSSENFCCPKHLIFDWPTPRCCHPAGFCCPLPYNVRDSQANSRCYGPTASCTLPLVPAYLACVHQPLPLPAHKKDTPEYDLSYPRYSNPDPKKTVAFASPQCTRAQVIREIFGNDYYNDESIQASAVPVNWFVETTKTQRMKQILKNDTSLNQQEFSWPEFILPFLFPISLTAISIASIIPLLLVSAIGWAVLYNCRFLGHKKTRMAIRKFLIYLEKRRRNFQYRSLPARHFRKARQGDRYQMPKAFQNSDLSSDDEPSELQTDIHPQTADSGGDIETLWTPEEIDRLGFDPDHIPLEWIYGDILGKPEKLKPEVRNYNSRQVGQRGDRVGAAGGTAGEGLDSDEWHDFISCRAKDTAKKEEGNVRHNVKETLRRLRRSSSRTPSSSQILTEAKSKKFKKGIIKGK